MTAKALIASAALCSLVACTPRRIPGTDIDDTTDTRSILQVMEQYRTAVEARDAEKVVSLAAPTFRDDMGTPTPADDLDLSALRARLPESLSRLEDVKLEMTVRKVDVDRKTRTARAIYTYTTSFRMPGLSAKPQGDSEIKEMAFARVGEVWKITSGI